MGQRFYVPRVGFPGEHAPKWEVLAQDRDVWSAWEGGFVQRATIKQEGRQPDVDSGDDGVIL